MIYNWKWKQPSIWRCKLYIIFQLTIIKTNILTNVTNLKTASLQKKKKRKNRKCDLSHSSFVVFHYQNFDLIVTYVSMEICKLKFIRIK